MEEEQQPKQPKQPKQQKEKEKEKEKKQNEKEKEKEKRKEKRKQLITLAKAAKEAKRFEEAILFMTKACLSPPSLSSPSSLSLSSSPPSLSSSSSLSSPSSLSPSSLSPSSLSQEERELLCFCWKSVINSKRASLRILSFAEVSAHKEDNIAHLAIVHQTQKRVEDELNLVCHNYIQFLREVLVPASTSIEAKAFFLKTIADYHRYLAEFSKDRETDIVQSTEAYSKGRAIAKSLNAANKITLEIALGHSLLHFHFLGAPDKACSIAKKAFDSGVAELSSLSFQQYQESVEVLNVLKENLLLWTSLFLGSDSDSSEGTTATDTSTY